METVKKKFFLYNMQIELKINFTFIYSMNQT